MARLLKDRRFWLVMAAIGVIAALRATGLGDLLSLETLRQHREALSGFVAERGVLAAAIYVAIYAVAVALSVPGALFLTLAGGFLFGAVWGTLLTVIGATIGAVVVFVFARMVLGEAALARLGPQGASLAEAIRRNAWSYLLVLRVTPLFPFFLVNLVPAFVGVPLLTYALTTFIGIIPGTAVFSLAGAGLGSVLDLGGDISVRAILTPQILAGLFGLAGLSLLAIPLRKRFERKTAQDT